MDTVSWYAQLIKPSWAPPNWLFGPIWTVLYLIIFVTFTQVFKLGLKKEIGFLVVLPFILNLIFNFCFTPIQFGLKNNYLALLDISLVLITLVWAIIAIYPISKWLALTQIPYLTWVIIATILQISITYLNR